MEEALVEREPPPGLSRDEYRREIQEHLCPTQDAQYVKEPVAINPEVYRQASLINAELWMMQTMEKSTYSGMRNLAQSTRTLLMTIAKEIAPHIIYHPIEKIPPRELTSLALLAPLPLATGQWSVPWITIGGLPFRCDDVANDPGRFYIQVVHSEKRSHLVGATGKVVMPIPNRKWKALLDENPEYNIPAGTYCSQQDVWISSQTTTWALVWRRDVYAQ